MLSLLLRVATSFCASLKIAPCNIPPHSFPDQLMSRLVKVPGQVEVPSLPVLSCFPHDSASALQPDFVIPSGSQDFTEMDIGTFEAPEWSNDQDLKSSLL